MMDGSQLSELIDQRWTTLKELLTLSQLQTEAIDAGRMTELMRILSQKQAPLNRLSELAKSLGSAADDDPSSRSWHSQDSRNACREQQSQCDEMHLELLAIEAACESALQKNRTAIQSDIEQLNASHQAAQRYAPDQSATTSGGSLDLSE